MPQMQNISAAYYPWSCYKSLNTNISQNLISLFNTICLKLMKILKKLVKLSHLGKYKYKHLPMGPKCTPAFAQQVMEYNLHRLDKIKVYFGDNGILSKTWKEHHMVIENPIPSQSSKLTVSPWTPSNVNRLSRNPMVNSLDVCWKHLASGHWKKYFLCPWTRPTMQHQLSAWFPWCWKHILAHVAY